MGNETKVIVETQQAFDQWMQEQQVASNDSQAVAVNPADLSTAEFLAPYTSGMNSVRNARANSQQPSPLGIGRGRSKDKHSRHLLRQFPTGNPLSSQSGGTFSLCREP